MTRNLTATNVGTGEYCVTPTAGSGIDTASELPVVSADYYSGAGYLHVAEVDRAAADCPSGSWEILTFEADTSKWQNIGFSIMAP